ncbi:MAG: metallophosphoesterase family protein [Chloroflexota bacterium]
MRIAVFSDLHGNPYACSALLEACRAAGVDALAVAGDVCLGGSHPAACVQMLRQAGALGVYGNTEEYLRAPNSAPTDEHHRDKWSWIQPAAHWTLEQLAAEEQRWLLGLPFALQFSPTPRPQDALQVVHANPLDVELMILPAPDLQQQLWGQVRQPDDDPALARALAPCAAGTLAFGHYHRPGIRRRNGQQLVNVSSASMPNIDRDPRARFSLFTWRAGAWQVEQHAVPYPIKREIAALGESSCPSRSHFLAYFP